MAGRPGDLWLDVRCGRNDGAMLLIAGEDR